MLRIVRALCASRLIDTLRYPDIPRYYSCELAGKINYLISDCDVKS